MSLELVERIHRFRATDDKGLYALARDVAKLTADRIDEKQLQTVVAPPKGTTWRSLKSLEKAHASKTMGPLFGIYELRRADAHLSSAEIDESKRARWSRQ